MSGGAILKTPSHSYIPALWFVPWLYILFTIYFFLCCFFLFYPEFLHIFYDEVTCCENFKSGLVPAVKFLKCFFNKFFGYTTLWGSIFSPSISTESTCSEFIIPHLPSWKLKSDYHSCVIWPGKTAEAFSLPSCKIEALLPKIVDYTPGAGRLMHKLIWPP